jgi:hypothetical protein
MQVEQIARYPVKGLSPEYLHEVDLSPGEGVPHDRRFAFAQGDGAFDPTAVRWLPKRNFACLAINARLAAIRAAYDPLENVIRLTNGMDGIAADLNTPSGRKAAADWITAYMGSEARGALRLAEAPGHAFTDIPEKALSVVGLESVAELGRRGGMSLDVLRFRPNIIFSGGAPFAELGWIGRELILGSARLRVFKRTQRCAATEVNPHTAERDARPPLWLRQNYGHADMGVYAEVVVAGRVAVGDALSAV